MFFTRGRWTALTRIEGVCCPIPLRPHGDQWKEELIVQSVTKDSLRQGKSADPPKGKEDLLCSPLASTLQKEIHSQEAGTEMAVLYALFQLPKES